MLAPFRKIGGLENVGAFQKNRRIWKMLAPYRTIGGFGKYWCLTEK
jgi:hypothetical protein